ncbi:MAG: S1 family peptidase [Propionibacteriaceae bacterium]|jgi:hypothetical protein|nr:S1 family peptidase [Propionibacteriaceae bacterium]
MRTRIFTGVLVATLLSASIGTATGSADSTKVPVDAGRGAYVHDSGLIVVGETVHLLPEHLRAEYATAYTLSQEAPNTFGLPSVQGDAVILPASSGDAKIIASAKEKAVAVMRVAEESASMPPDKEKALLPDVKQVEEMLRVAQVTESSLSYARITRANDYLFDLRDASEFASAGIWGSEIDQPSGSIILSVKDLSSKLADFIKESFGTQLVRVRIAPQPQATPSAGRQSDSSPFYGGARINTPTGFCTDAFAWKISSSEKGMPTAGHCAPSAMGW